MSFQIGGGGGGFGPVGQDFSQGGVQGGPQVQGGEQFKADLKNKSNDELVTMFALGNLSPQAQKDVMNELMERFKTEAQAAGGAGGVGGAGEEEEEDKLKELLKKLREGTISAEELDKLAEMLGVSPDALEALKGKGSTPYDKGPDITGG